MNENVNERTNELNETKWKADRSFRARGRPKQTNDKKKTKEKNNTENKKKAMWAQ